MITKNRVLLLPIIIMSLFAFAGIMQAFADDGDTRTDSVKPTAERIKVELRLAEEDGDVKIRTLENKEEIREESMLRTRTQESLPVEKTERMELHEDRVENIENREEKRAEIETTREEKRSELEEKRMEREAELEENRKERIEAYFTRVIRRLDSAIERLDKLAERTESRILKFEEEGVDVSDVRDLISTARDAISTAKAGVDSIRDGAEDLLDSETGKDSFGKMKEVMGEVVVDIKVAHKALVDVIVSLKGSIDKEEETEETEEVEEEEETTEEIEETEE